MNEVIETIKKMVADENLSQEVAEKYFPQLKESCDEKVKKALTHLVTANKESHFGIDNYDGIKWTTLQEWIEKQGEQNPAWSKEDDFQCREAIEAVVETNYSDERKVDVITWLEALKDRYTWKPSDMQMRILSIYADQNNSHGTVLTSLYQDLKKLKG